MVVVGKGIVVAVPHIDDHSMYNELLGTFCQVQILVDKS